MRVAIVSESTADETAIRVLVDAALGVKTLPVVPAIRYRPGHTFLRDLPAILRALHRAGTVDGLVAVVDSDDTPIHQPDHEDDPEAALRCRLCEARELLRQAQGDLAKRDPEHQPIRTALGLAVPAMEGWYLSGRDPDCTEAAWLAHMAEHPEGTSFRHVRVQLKQKAYGRNRPSLGYQTRAAVEHARRLATNLDALAENFPNGFGPLLRDLRAWLVEAG